MSETVSENRPSALIEVSSADNGQNRKIKGTVQQFVGKSLTLVSDEEIAASSIVRVQSKDLLFLGEVLRSVHNAPANWTIHLSVRRTFAVL